MASHIETPQLTLVDPRFLKQGLPAYFNEDIWTDGECWRPCTDPWIRQVLPPPPQDWNLELLMEDLESLDLRLIEYHPPPGLDLKHSW